MTRYQIAITVTRIDFDGNMEIPTDVQSEDVVFEIPDSLEHKFKEFYTKIFIYFLQKSEKFVKIVDKAKMKQKSTASFSKFLLTKK